VRHQPYPCVWEEAVMASTRRLAIGAVQQLKRYFLPETAIGLRR
jgi:hypothetical protein